MPEHLRCSHCQDVIGVYEPLVAIVDGGVVEASRARLPDLGTAAVAYHRDCFARLHSVPGPVDEGGTIAPEAA